MISNELYELAFEYKKTRLWKKITDTHIFAVKLSGGGTGYICIMGLLGEHCALALYAGDDAFNSWRATQLLGGVVRDEQQMYEYAMQQNCLQCEFTSKEFLSDEEYKEALAQIRRLGIKPAGKNAYPQFVKYFPECCPWRLQSGEEQVQLCEALSAAIEVASLLEENTDIPEFEQMREKTEYIPMLELKDGKYIIGKTKLPAYEPRKNPEPVLSDLYAAKLKKMKKEGDWKCEVVRLMTPVQTEPDTVPRYPTVLIAVEPQTKQLYPMQPVVDYDENAVKLLNDFAGFLVDMNTCPKSIEVRDDRTYSLLKQLSAKLNIPLIKNENSEALAEIVDDFADCADNYSDDDEDDMIREITEAISNMSDFELRKMPPELIKQLKVMADMGEFPEDTLEKLDALFERQDRNAPLKRKKGKSEHSYTISVSLQSGCYRHIQVPGRYTLEELAWAILDAFEFDNDHAHAFFMDNKLWSRRNCYYMRGVEEGERTTDRYTLDDVGLYKDMPFKFVFDFGDEWVFQCKVMREEEKRTDRPIVIKSKGEAPEQYPVW